MMKRVCKQIGHRWQHEEGRDKGASEKNPADDKEEDAIILNKLKKFRRRGEEVAELMEIRLEIVGLRKAINYTMESDSRRDISVETKKMLVCEVLSAFCSVFQVMTLS